LIVYAGAGKGVMTMDDGLAGLTVVIRVLNKLCLSSYQSISLPFEGVTL
jgi:hypothetical protein